MNRLNVLKTLRQITQSDEEAFTGPIVMPSPLYEVGDEDGQQLVLDLVECAPTDLPLPAALVPQGVRLCEFADTDVIGEVGAFINDTCVGVYAGSCLWVAPEYRGQGIGPALAIAAAVTRGGSVVGDWEMHGYCEAGLSAHERAYQAIIDWSMAPVPEEAPQP